MKRLSAGLLVYRFKDNRLEVLLAHPGGPFWAKKDLGAWTLPKGEYDDSEEPLQAAKREFEEEIGQPAPKGEAVELGELKRKDGKTIIAWAVKGDIDTANIRSNTFSIEWPPRSGKKQEFPEVDRAEWVPISEASEKLHTGQPIFIERLTKHLKIEIQPKTEQQEPDQKSLF